jgi:signal peptidase I
MKAKKLIKETRGLLKRKARKITPEGKQEVEDSIAELEQAISRKAPKQVEKAKESLRKAVSRHVPHTKLDVVLDYAYSLATAVLIALVIRHFVVEPFKIPSGSMIPTLNIGDKILVNKFTYGLRIPFTTKRLVEIGRPRRWDVVVFTTSGIPDASQYPKNFVKRVVGLPGETLEIREGEILKYVPDGKGGEKVMAISKPEWLSDLHYANTQEGQTIRLQEWDHAKFLGIRLPWTNGDAREDVRGYWRYGKESQKFIVPEGQYFVLGDNTLSSFDSRGWGFVPFGNIKGKVICKWSFLPPFGKGLVR